MNANQFLGRTGLLLLLLKEKKHHNDEQKSGEEKISIDIEIKSLL